MSLSEQINRVDGSQNSTLKTILEKLGVSPGSSKIDQYPTVANGISNKVSPENIVSSSTATSFGLSSSATANQVFVKIKSLIDTVTSTANSKTAIVIGSYTGDGSYSANTERQINLGFKPKAVLFSAAPGIAAFGGGAFLSNNNNYYNALITSTVTQGTAYISLESYGFRVFQGGNAQFNYSGYVYRYIAFK